MFPKRHGNTERHQASLPGYREGKQVTRSRNLLQTQTLTCLNKKLADGTKLIVLTVNTSTSVYM